MYQPNEKAHFCGKWSAVTSIIALPLFYASGAATPASALYVALLGYALGRFLLVWFLRDPVAGRISISGFAIAAVGMLLVQLAVPISHMIFWDLIGVLTGEASFSMQTMHLVFQNYLNPLGLGIALYPISLIAGILIQGFWRLRFLEQDEVA